MAGVAQINVVIPNDTATGLAGERRFQPAGLTIAMK